MFLQSELVRFLCEILFNLFFYDVGWLMGLGIVGGYFLFGDVYVERVVEMVFVLLVGVFFWEILVEFMMGQEWVFDVCEFDCFGWCDCIFEGLKFFFEVFLFWLCYGELILVMVVIVFVVVLIIVVFVMMIVV